MEKYCRAGQDTDENSAHAHCMLIPKDTHTHTHSEYGTLIAIPWQQWLHERALTLRLNYTACLVYIVCCSVVILYLF